MPLITGNSADLHPFMQPNTTTQATVPILQQPPQLPINPHAIQSVQKDRILDQVECFIQVLQAHIHPVATTHVLHAMVSWVAKIASAQEIPLWPGVLICGSPASSWSNCSHSTMRNSSTFGSVNVNITPWKLSTFKGSFPPPLYKDTWHSLRLHNEVQHTLQLHQHRIPPLQMFCQHPVWSGAFPALSFSTASATSSAQNGVSRSTSSFLNDLEKSSATLHSSSCS